MWALKLSPVMDKDELLLLFKGVGMKDKDRRQFASRISGGNSATGRKAGDFYPTPPEATIALLKFLHILSDSVVWECACGGGMMSRAIEKVGYETISTDVEDMGFGYAGIDFLTCQMEEKFDWIITNPPFSAAEKFIRKAWEYEKPFAFL